MGDVVRSIELGRAIGITCRILAKKIASPGDFIAKSNLRGFLKLISLVIGKAT